MADNAVLGGVIEVVREHFRKMIVSKHKKHTNIDITKIYIGVVVQLYKIFMHDRNVVFSLPSKGQISHSISQ